MTRLPDIAAHPNQVIMPPMKTPTPVRHIALFAVLLAAGGCQMLRPHEPAPPPPPPEPVVQAPVATHKFQFDPAKDEVVGELQVTRVQGEDTLPDIARRFNLGY